MVSVFLYVPNLIGYARVIMAIASYHFINDPSQFLPLYAVSCLLDAVDGHAARFLGQSSKFGAVLDMVTDRSTTAGLVCYLASLYPSFMLAFQILLGLDLSSHYMHMYASLSSGATSHKTVDGKQNRNFLMRAYYGSKVVMFFVCAGNELFYLGLYLMHHFRQGKVWIEIGGYPLRTYHIFTASVAPVFFFKQVMNVVQLSIASQKLVDLDSKQKSK